MAFIFCTCTRQVGSTSTTLSSTCARYCSVSSSTCGRPAGVRDWGVHPSVAPQSPLWCPAHHAEVLDLAVQPAHGVRPAGLALRVGVHVAVEAGTDGRHRVGGCQGSPGQPSPSLWGDPERVLLNKPLRGQTRGSGPRAHQSEILRIFCPICSPQ